jgi:hypothetical protein
MLNKPTPSYIEHTIIPSYYFNEVENEVVRIDPLKRGISLTFTLSNPTMRL